MCQPRTIFENATLPNPLVADPAMGSRGIGLTACEYIMVCCIIYAATCHGRGTAGMLLGERRRISRLSLRSQIHHGKGNGSGSGRLNPSVLLCAQLQLAAKTTNSIAQCLSRTRCKCRGRQAWTANMHRQHQRENWHLSVTLEVTLMPLEEAASSHVTPQRNEKRRHCTVSARTELSSQNLSCRLRHPRRSKGFPLHMQHYRSHGTRPSAQRTAHSAMRPNALAPDPTLRVLHAAPRDLLFTSCKPPRAHHIPTWKRCTSFVTYHVWPQHAATSHT